MKICSGHSNHRCKFAEGVGGRAANQLFAAAFRMQLAKLADVLQQAEA